MTERPPRGVSLIVTDKPIHWPNWWHYSRQTYQFDTNTYAHIGIKMHAWINTVHQAKSTNTSLKAVDCIRSPHFMFYKIPSFCYLLHNDRGCLSRYLVWPHHRANNADPCNTWWTSGVATSPSPVCLPVSLPRKVSCLPFAIFHLIMQQSFFFFFFFGLENIFPLINSKERFIWKRVNPFFASNY